MTSKRAEAGTAHVLEGEGKIGGTFVSTRNPNYLGHRVKYWDELYEEQQKALLASNHDEITIELPDGTTKVGRRLETSPMDIAIGISKGLAGVVVVGKVLYSKEVEPSKKFVDTENLEVTQEDCCCGGDPVEKWELWDLNRPLIGSCKLILLKFDSDEAKHVFWHSSSHILGQALEIEFGVHLTVGPALEKGFYYDAYMGEDLKFNAVHYECVTSTFEKCCREDQKFERLELTKSQALEMFQHNPFKVQLISSKIPANGMTTAYRCGTLIDLCRGPHVPTTARVKAFAIEKSSSAYWLGNLKNDSLQRIYGISFPDSKMLKEHQHLMEEAKKRDHRVLGQQLDLFFFESTLSPGCAFWLPGGTRLYNKLCDFMRAEYKLRGFQEVVTPNIFSSDLFKISGHYQNYRDDIFMFDVEGKEWGLKPMNCPGHCLMFKHMRPSYRQLPIRLADFGVLHRNELSGSLSGMTRVRRFQQDDAHIFARLDQVKQEVHEALNFLFFVYGKLGFEFEMKLATRPKKALGTVELWTEAESQLREALNECGMPWTLNPGDGAFYGPKIDIRLKDALDRFHQCGTVQLDFQLPLRFNLLYRTAEAATEEKSENKQIEVEEQNSRPDGSLETDVHPGFARPVIIHRAILGSIERMAAVLVEHVGGKFPFWISPRQAIVLPISDKFLDFANWVAENLSRLGYASHVDDSNATINKKIREAQVAQWNFMLVVGQQELESRTVTVRERDDPKTRYTVTVPDLLQKFELLCQVNSRNLKEFVDFQPAAAKPEV